MSWHVYIIKCKDGLLYTGITNNLKRRIQEHNSGKGCRFTRCRIPVRLLYSEISLSRSDALKREAQIKRMEKEEKVELIKNMKTKPDAEFMGLALREAQKNLTDMRGGPFGACIVKGSKVIAVSRNTVLKQDASCHAEINAIRKAAKKLRTYDLSGCSIYSTTEPCPMCFSAIHWSRIDVLVYGNTIADAKCIGFNELSIPSAKMKKLGKAKLKIVCGCMREEVNQLFKDWNKLPGKKTY